MVLHSNFNGTASVDMVNDGIHGNLLNASNVSVQRYRRDGRAWVLMTTPLSTNGADTSLHGDIKSNWQADTQIFGATTASGLDPGPTTNACMKSWNGSTWVGITNTIANNSLFGNAGGTAADNKTFFLFVKGNRNVSSFIPNIHGSDSLVATGNLQTGNKICSFSGKTYGLVGNPYPAPIDLNAFYNANQTNITGTFYYWDPNMNSLGGYVTCTNLGGYFNCVPGSVGSNVYIQSGEGFFVHPKAGNTDTTVYFTESMKSTANSKNNVFGTTNQSDLSLLTINLNSYDTLGNKKVVDGVGEMFSSNYSDSVNIVNEDITKLYNNQENLCILRTNNYLSIEKRSPLTSFDTIFFYLTGLQANTNYQYEFNPYNLSTNGLTGYLVDNYLKTSTAISLSSRTTINFNIDANVASKSDIRFMIVFKGSPLGLKFTGIKAQQNDGSANVFWTTSNEVNISEFEIEKSTNGQDYISIGMVNAKNTETASYNWLDINLSATDYYRIKAIEKTGNFSYSDVVLLNKNNTGEQIGVYPNPVINSTFSLHLNHITKGVYKINLINSDGQVVGSRVSNYEAGSVTELISMPTLSAGIYILTIEGNGQVYHTELIAK